MDAASRNHLLHPVLNPTIITFRFVERCAVRKQGMMTVANRADI
jgi:hypothetical protein